MNHSCGLPLSSGLSTSFSRSSEEIVPRETCVVCKLDNEIIMSCISAMWYLMHNGLKVHSNSCYFMDSVSIKYIFQMTLEHVIKIYLWYPVA